jgi:hypothetical protein
MPSSNLPRAMQPRTKIGFCANTLCKNHRSPLPTDSLFTSVYPIGFDEDDVPVYPTFCHTTCSLVDHHLRGFYVNENLTMNKEGRQTRSGSNWRHVKADMSEKEYHDIYVRCYETRGERAKRLEAEKTENDE